MMVVLSWHLIILKVFSTPKDSACVYMYIYTSIQLWKTAKHKQLPLINSFINTNIFYIPVPGS